MCYAGTADAVKAVKTVALQPRPLIDAAMTKISKKPVSKKHFSAVKTALHSLSSMRSLSNSGSRASVALAATKRLLRRETLRHQACEKQLKEAAKHYSQLLAHSCRMQDQARRVAHQVLMAQEEERKEISRELHDEIAQILAGINVQLAALSEAAAIDSQALKRKISQTQQLVEESVEVVHRYARELRPALLDDLGLIPALRSYIRELPARRGLCIQFTAFAGVEALENARRTVLYRVAQEALTNVIRHAHAKSVTVRVHKIADNVRLVVHDDGKSFQVERILNSTTNKRLGLIGMRERVVMVGGELNIESEPGKGTTVTAVLPFRKNRQGSTK